MEEHIDEQMAMAEFLSQHLSTVAPEQAERLALAVYPPGTDVEAMKTTWYRLSAEAWTVPLRSNPEYLAWRREREPGYVPLDDSEPTAMARLWENLTPEAWAALPEAYREERVRLARESIVLGQWNARDMAGNAPWD